MNQNYYYIIPIILLLIAVISIAVYLYINNNKLKVELKKSKNKHKTLEDSLINESKELEIHKEELTAQAEHLKELNVELERLSLVASHTDNGVVIADKNGNLLWANKGFEKITGFNLDEMKKTLGKDIFTASNKENLKDFIKKSIAQKESINYISEFKAKSGNIIWLNTLINPILDKYGEIKQFIILETDISDLKLMNDRLKKLSLVAKKTNNAILIYDAKENLDFVNEGFYKLYGYTKEEYEKKYGNTFNDFCVKNKKYNLKEKLLERKNSLSFANEFENNKGAKKWKQSSVTPVFDIYGVVQNFIVTESDITKIKNVEKHIQTEKDKSDKLLLNIFPEEIAEELKSKGKVTPRFYRSTSVLFADIQNFTKKAENLTPKELVQVLQAYFLRFDDAVVKYFVEKIKVIGDSLLCVGGIPLKNNSHPFDTILLGLELQQIMKDIVHEQIGTDTSDWNLRVGIHTGPLVAGVVGKQKIAYDIWGDSVNIAKRIESACLPGMVNISSETYRHVKDYFVCENRGKILAKHKGHIDMYFVSRLKPEFSEDKEGLVPNHDFKEMLAKL